METLENNGVKTLDELNYEERVRDIPLLTFLFILCFTGIVGNVLVLYIFIKTYALSTFRMFVIFLSAVDLISCTVAIPLEIVTLLLDYKNDIVWLCKLYPFLLSWPTITSIFLLLAIASDRYRKVCTPFSWQVSCRAAKNIFVVAVSLGSLCSAMRPVMFGVRTTTHLFYNLTIYECEVTEPMAKTPLPLLSNLIFSLIFIGALIGIITLYCCIAVRVRQQIKRKHQMRSSIANNKVSVSNKLKETKTTTKSGLDNETPVLECGSSDKGGGKKLEISEKDVNLKDTKPTTKFNVLKKKPQTSSNRATLVMVLVSSVFFISFLPSVSLLLARALDKGFSGTLTNFDRSVYKFVFRAYLLNCVINPIIYGIFDPHFRKSCKMICSCRLM